MQKDSLSFLTELLETEAPSGFEQPIQRVVKARAKKFADDVRVDVHGNLIASINADAPVRVMLAGHCDQIGLMVTYISDKGFIHFSAIGGVDPSVLPGTRVSIVTRQGVVEGVIGYKPAHLIPKEKRGLPVELDKLWIDIGAEDSKDARKRVEIGDPITYRLGISRLSANVIASPGCDDRVGAFVVMEALRLFSQAIKKGTKSEVGLFAVSTVQEELGLRGARTSAYEVDPHVGIAVDVTHASDNPGAEAKQIGEVNLGAGPTIARGANINPIIGELLEATAKKKKIKYQTISSPIATGTDANAMQINRRGVATALIGIPNRYMHTQVEVVDLRDLEAASELLAETVLQIKKKTSFIPV